MRIAATIPLLALIGCVAPGAAKIETGAVQFQPQAFQADIVAEVAATLDVKLEAAVVRITRESVQSAGDRSRVTGDNSANNLTTWLLIGGIVVICLVVVIATTGGAWAIIRHRVKWHTKHPNGGDCRKESPPNAGRIDETPTGLE